MSYSFRSAGAQLICIHCYLYASLMLNYLSLKAFYFFERRVHVAKYQIFLFLIYKIISHALIKGLFQGIDKIRRF